MANLALPNSPVIEDMICSMLESSFNTIIALIDVGIILPQKALALLKAIITRIEGVIFVTILAQLDTVEALILDLLKIKELRQLSASDFCLVLFQCKAALNIIVDLGLLTSSQANDFETVENLICKGGIANLITSFVQDQLDKITVIINAIKAQLDEFLDPIIGSLQVLVDAYQKALDDAGITALLAQLDAFADCIFSICDFVESALNKTNDTQTKLFVDKNGKFDETVIFKSLRATEQNINDRIAAIELQIASLPNAGDVNIDDIMKDNI